MRKTSRTLFLGLLVLILVVGPALVHYRVRYNHAKRLRVVVPGMVYRSGQLTEDGLREAIRAFGIRAVINLQDELPEPVFAGGKLESELCAEMGARFIFLPPDLISRWKLAHSRPRAVDDFLRIMDDPRNYPVLLHCRAGLHRTGTLVALYRMEYERWSPTEALLELQENGFGRTFSNARNDYLSQYLLNYQPRPRPLRGELRELSTKD
jgi:tyrosine-protein phosphatase SIW14